MMTQRATQSEDGRRFGLFQASVPDLIHRPNLGALHVTFDNV
jgi:hypothetical protein